MTAFIKVCNIVSTVLVVVLTVIAILFAGAKLIGFEVYSVGDNNSIDKYQNGDLVYAKPCNAEELKTDDTIAYVTESRGVATYNVLSVSTSAQTVYTDAEDLTLFASNINNVIGKPVFSIPFLGFILAFIQTSVGKYVSIAVGAFVVILVFLPDIIVKKEKKKPEEISDESVEENTEEVTEEASCEVAEETAEETAEEAAEETVEEEKTEE